jgi:hypothetical protein
VSDLFNKLARALDLKLYRERAKRDRSGFLILCVGHNFIPPPQEIPNADTILKCLRTCARLPKIIEANKKFFAGFIATFPDVKAVIHNQVTEGDKVVTHKTFHGTHKGEFMGIPPTGKKVAIELVDIFRIAGGKLMEH